jgi:O-antigen/teichoic acid export membrane protein
MFSSYIAQGNKETIKKSYSIIERYCIFVAISVGIFIVSFSKELLSIFGEQYTDNYLLLIILAVGSSFGTLQYVNNPLLISTEKNKERVLNSVIRIGIQLLLTLLLLEKFGVLGIVLARVSALVAGQIIPIYVVTKKLPYGIKVPREFFWGALSVLLCGLICCLLEKSNIFYSAVLFMLSFAFFFLGARFGYNDFRFVLNLVLRK